MMKKVIRNQYPFIYEQLKDKPSWEYIDPLGLTSRDIETFYQRLHLDVQHKPKDPYVENQLKDSPSFVTTFYYFIYLYQKIPSQPEFMAFFYWIHTEWIKKEVRHTYHEAFMGRLCRFYPSMLRDIHFYHVAKESGQFTRVLFMLKYDLEGKVDLFLQHQHKTWFGIQLRTQTKRSDYYYEKKKTRSPLLVNAQLLDVPINLQTAYSLRTQKDDIKLYGPTHVQYIQEQIHTYSLQPSS